MSSGWHKARFLCNFHTRHFLLGCKGVGVIVVEEDGSEVSVDPQWEEEGDDGYVGVHVRYK